MRGLTTNCYKCTKRYIGCHGKCEDYIPNTYNEKDTDIEYNLYLGEAKARIKRSKNLFRRGIRNDEF